MALTTRGVQRAINASVCYRVRGTCAWYGEKGILTQWVLKVAYEVVATSFTYLVVGFLKRLDNLDTYGDHTNFNPILLNASLMKREPLVYAWMHLDDVGTLSG